MNTNPTASDWGTSRGEKWRAHLPGMEAMLRPIDEPLITALKLDAPCRVADIGSGGGSTTLEILRRAPAGSVVHGFDISPQLVELARTRAKPDDRSLAFEVADMAQAKPAAPYDRLASRLGVMFFDDPPAAFANLLRWLAPGGSFAFAVWGTQSENLWMTTVRDVVTELVELPRVDPDAPGAYRYADASKFVALLEGAGFSDVGVHDWKGALPVAGRPEEAAQFGLAAFSTFAEVLAKAGEDTLRQAQRALASKLSRHQRGAAVWLDACVHIVTGGRGGQR